MTRRTPEPGDSFCSRNMTIEVHDVMKGQVYFAQFTGPWAYLWDLRRMDLELFHRLVAIETWGRA
jgi:hypothetical protein